MKKGIVLLITLFFIAAISILILKNLDDVNSFLDEQNYALNNIQVLIAVKDVKNQVARNLKNSKEDVNKILEDGSLFLPISYDSLNIEIEFDNYSKIDINEINNPNSSVEKWLLSKEIFDFALLRDIYNEKLKYLSKDNKKVNNSKQVDDIINTFVIKSFNNKIEEYRNELGFLVNKDLYALNINVEFNGTKAKAYYYLNKEGEVQYFDISFK